MKRVLTYIGSIFGGIAGGFCLASQIYNLIAVIPLLALLGESSGVVAGADGATFASGIIIFAFILLIFDVALGVTTCVLNEICYHKLCKVSKEEFAKRKGVVISAIVFNFITAAFMIIGIFVSVTGIISIVINVILIGFFITSGILYIVDLCKEKNRVFEVPASTPATQPEQPKVETFDKYDELAKLSELHDRKALTDEEYQKSKDEILNK